MTLTINPKTRAFILTSDDEKKARAVGLTLSTRMRGPNGEKLWYTGDRQHKPTSNPYAALPFFDEADAKARSALRRMQNDYMSSWADDSPNFHPCPDGREYMPYQRAGIDYALARKNSLIGDSPGLGKTIQAIGVANAMGATKILVLCPASIRRNWRREIKSWSVIPNVMTQAIEKSSQGVSPHVNYTIVSYDLNRNPGIHEALYDMQWDLLILDEAHYLKTMHAQRTRAVFGGGQKAIFKNTFLASRAERIVALTGTPLPNRPRECYMLARGLCWESIDWASWDDFTYRFNPSGFMDSGYLREEKGRLPELQARLRTNFMVRRLKEDVLKDLPDKRYEFTYVEPNGAIKKVLAKESLLDFDPQSLTRKGFKIDGQVATVRREMGEAMAPRVAEHIKYLLEVVEIPKIILLYHHNSVIDMLIEKLAHYGMLGIRGGMSDTAKEQSMDRFISDPKIRIFRGQLDTMEGLDGLQQVAEYAVFAEPAWTEGRNQQCVDRLHRYGQHGNVVAQFVLAEGSFNEKVLKDVLIKTRDIHETLDNRMVI